MGTRALSPGIKQLGREVVEVISQNVVCKVVAVQNTR
jgi:hypothetical protein